MHPCRVMFERFLVLWKDSSTCMFLNSLGTNVAAVSKHLFSTGSQLLRPNVRIQCVRNRIFKPTSTCEMSRIEPSHTRSEYGGEKCCLKPSFSGCHDSTQVRHNEIGDSFVSHSMIDDQATPRSTMWPANLCLSHCSRRRRSF